MFNVIGSASADSFGYFGGGSGATKGGVYLGNSTTKYGGLWFDNANNNVYLQQQFTSGTLQLGANSATIATLGGATYAFEILGLTNINATAAASGGTVQTLRVSGAADASITVNSGATNAYAYFTFAQAGVARWEMGSTGGGGAGSNFYINSNIQTGETGASVFIRKADGNVGIKGFGSSTYDFSVTGVTYVSSYSVGTMKPRLGVTTYSGHPVGDYLDAPIMSLTNTEDNWIYLDQASAEWGIYHRNIDTALAVVGQQTLPGNSIAFIGASNLGFYINLGTGAIWSKSISTSGAAAFGGSLSASNFSGSSSGTNTGDVTIGTANGLSLSGQALSLALSSASATGALSSTDWTTFNNKQAAGNYVTTDTTQTITGQKTISRGATSYNGTTQSFLIDGTNGALTINSNGSSPYAYLTFAQVGIAMIEMGVEGAVTNQGSLYINRNVQSGSTGASIFVKKSDGYVGFGTINPTAPVSVVGSNAFGYFGMAIANNGGFTGAAAGIDFGTDGSTYYNGAGNGQIKVINTASSNAADMVFSLYNGSSFNEYVRISGTGTYNLNVSGTIGANAFYESSDIRFKNILETNPNISAAGIDVIKFTRKNSEQVRYGYSAQQVKSVLPDAVIGDDELTVNYSDVHTLKIAGLEKRVLELELRLKSTI